MSIKDNIAVAILNELTQYGFISEKQSIKMADEQIKKLNVKTDSRYLKIGSLSGGNQQKAMIGKWLVVKPDIIIMDEPTRGIDVGAKSEIHFMLRELCNKGIGVIIISSEMPEVLGVSDDIIVMHEGKVTGLVTNEDLCEKNLMMLASGRKLSFAEEKASE